MNGEMEILEKVKRAFGDRIETAPKRERQAEIRVPLELLHPLIGYLKAQGFGHLATISCVDWIEGGEFELVYHLWSYERRFHLLVKTRIDRENPTVETIIPIFRIAETYERELHEMFGIDFPGNPNLTPLLLEDWDGPPPMRRDFDTRKYVEEKYGMVDLTKELWERQEPILEGENGED